MTTLSQGQADARYAPQIPNLVAPYDPRVPFQHIAQAIAVNDAYLCRVLVPRTGTLRGLSTIFGTQSGNFDLGVYSTEATRQRLYHIGSTPVPAIEEWATFDPNLAVTAGQALDFALSFDNTTARAVGSGADNENQHQLPAGFVPSSGAAPKLTGRVLSAFPLPATIAEAAVLGAGLTPLIIARVEPAAVVPGGPAFAVPGDVALRLGRSLTTDEENTAEDVIVQVTGFIVDAVDRDAAWAAALSPVPAALKGLCVEKARIAILNASGVVSRTLGQSSVTYSRSLDGGTIFLTPQEERMVRQAVYGALTGSSTPRALEDRLIDLAENRDVDEIEVG